MDASRDELARLFINLWMSYDRHGKVIISAERGDVPDIYSRVTRFF